MKLTTDGIEEAIEVAEVESQDRVVTSARDELAALLAALTKKTARIAELEAIVLASDSVSRVEYDAMVKQRDDMRAERQQQKAFAEGRLGVLREVNGELKRLKANPGESWRLEEALFTLQCALEYEGEDPEGVACGRCGAAPGAPCVPGGYVEVAVPNGIAVAPDGSSFSISGAISRGLDELVAKGLVDRDELDKLIGSEKPPCSHGYPLDVSTPTIPESGKPHPVTVRCSHCGEMFETNAIFQFHKA